MGVNLQTLFPANQTLAIVARHNKPALRSLGGRASEFLSSLWTRCPSPSTRLKRRTRAAGCSFRRTRTCRPPLQSAAMEKGKYNISSLKKHYSCTTLNFNTNRRADLHELCHQLVRNFVVRRAPFLLHLAAHFHAEVPQTFALLCIKLRLRIGGLLLLFLALRTRSGRNSASSSSRRG